MKLKYRINLASLSILFIVAMSIAAIGSLAISQATFDLNREIMRREVENLVNEIRDAQAVLQDSGVDSVTSYVARAQQDLLASFGRYRFKETGEIMIFALPDMAPVFGPSVSDPKPFMACVARLDRPRGDFECILDGRARYFRYDTVEVWDWQVFLSVALVELQGERNRFLSRVALILVVALVGGGILFVWLGGRVVRPIRQLAEATTRVRRGEWDVVLPDQNGRDEIGQLSRAFGHMASGLAESQQRQEAHVAQLESSREALSASEARFRALVETSSDIIWEVDHKGCYAYISPKVRQVLGYMPEELVGRSPSDFAADDDETASDIRTLFDQGRPIDGLERRCRHRQGSVVILETSGVPVFDTTGMLTGYRGVDRDITERKRAERENQRLYDQLLHAQRMEAIGTLAGGIAHDFNNLLQAILSGTELLMMEIGEDETQRHGLKLIYDSASRGADLSRQLLMFSRKLESRLRPIDLKVEVEKASQILSRTIPKMIEIVVTADGGNHVINGDPSQIEQALINLAVNAKDAMPEGGELTLDLACAVPDAGIIGEVNAPPDATYVRLQVADTGRGMTSEVQSKIFDPFFTTKGLAEGTGLGLAMVYGIVKNHHGAIVCQSKPDEGTTFNLFFPCIDGAVLMDKGGGTEAVNGGQETILLVDDEAAVRDMATAMLSKKGYRVWSANDGSEALSIYSRQPERIDLVILDLIMPGMDGMRCLDQLKAIDPAVRVLVCSGYAEGAPDDRCIQAGARAFLSKPYQLHTLLKAVRQVLDD